MPFHLSDLPDDLVAGIVDALPDSERLVINGIYWEGLSFSEMASELGLQGKWTITRLHEQALLRMGVAIREFEENLNAVEDS